MEKRKDPKDNEHISSERCLIYVRKKHQLVELESGDLSRSKSILVPLMRLRHRFQLPCVDIVLRLMLRPMPKLL